VTFVGSLQEGKGVLEVLKTAKILKDLGFGERFNFRIVGKWFSDEFEVQARKMHKDLELEGMVDLVGQLTGDLKWDAYYESDVFFFPTHYASEATPIVIMEALGAGLHILSTEWAGIPKMLEGCKAATLHPVRSPNLYAASLIKLASDDERAMRDFTHAQAFYQQHFLPSRFIGRVNNAFLEVNKADACEIHASSGAIAIGHNASGLDECDKSIAPTSLKRTPYPHPTKPKILQIFSRYRQYGGEESRVFQIGDAMNRDFDVGFYLGSSEDTASIEIPPTLARAVMCFSNREAVRDLRHLQKVGAYDYWLVHNVFPALSPSVYTLAFELGVPVVQYLHNYRMGCVNGFFLNHGKPCQRCMHGNFLPALQTACWHGSHLQSGAMGAITAMARGKDLFHRIHRWIAISEAQKQEHVLMGIPEERITVIHHFYESKAEAPAYPVEGDALFVGRLSPEKGVDRLLKAWALIQHSGRFLWIVGDGPEREKLERMVSALNLTNVRFTGFLDHEGIAGIWERTACSIVPSIWKEPFGMVVLEAWAKGRPVVAHALGSLPELIRHGEDGLVVAPDDPRVMADAILSILNDPAKGAAMGRSGFQNLNERFSLMEWQEKIRPIFI
jgi:glycosyltransferase involved in cell wall biosynthesis